MNFFLYGEILRIITCFYWVGILVKIEMWTLCKELYGGIIYNRCPVQLSLLPLMDRLIEY